ncbi:MAG: FeoA family protein, partial [Bacteroidetes bacterium]|nr:FeoA family protein [Bacteroidota bacterium]
MSTLFDLREGEHGLIAKVRGRGAFRKRITEMGFVRGKEVSVVKSAPLLDPVEYKILGYNVSLRQSEARLIEIIPIGAETAASSAETEKKQYNGTIEEETLR